MEVDGLVLTWEPQHGSALLTVGSQIGGSTNIRNRACVRLDVAGHRLRISLSFHSIKRVVDISVQPSIFEEVLPIERGPCPLGSAGSTVAGWIAELAGDSTAWRPKNHDAIGLTGTAGGVAFPILGAAYDRGASPLGTIPRWAAPVLSTPNPRSAASAAVGERVSRRVVKALAASLLEPETEGGSLGPVSLFRLALALMGTPVLEPDRLARVLETAGPRRPAEALPTLSEIAAGRSLIRCLGPAQAERLLVDVIEQPDGAEQFAEILRDGPGVFDQLPERPPHRLETLRDHCRGLLPVDPCPEAGRWSTARGSAVQIAGRDSGATGNDAPALGGRADRKAVGTERSRARPRARRDRSRETRVPTAPKGSLIRQSLAALQGREVGHGLRIVVPRSAAELNVWGRRLCNCVGSYGSAFERGRTDFLGVELDEVLTYCMEINSSGIINQFLGVRNRPVPPEHARLVANWLVDERVIGRVGQWGAQ